MELEWELGCGEWRFGGLGRLGVGLIGDPSYQKYFRGRCLDGLASCFV